MNNFKKIDLRQLSTNQLTLLAILGFIFIYIVGFWNLIKVVLPLALIWLIWIKSNFSKKKKFVFTGIILGIILMIIGFSIYSDRTPSLTIQNPQDNTSIQSNNIYIKGKVSPLNSEVIINGVTVETKYGLFNYQFKLNDSTTNNTISIVAKNGYKTSNKELIISRIFTDEEKAIIENTKIKAQQEKDARLAKEKEELDLYYKTPAGRICKKYPSWDKDICEILAKGKVRIGMTAEQARVSWGNPDDINRTISTYGNREQWVYGHSSYLYFDDGVLTSIQN
jgi:hypothetical protein